MQRATIFRYNWFFSNENSKEVFNQFRNLAPTFWFMTKPDKTDYEVPELQNSYVRMAICNEMKEVGEML